MLFPEILNQIQQNLRPEMDKIFHDTIANSSHPNDLLIWFINGNYQPIIAGKKLNPHTIGQGIEGISESTHYDFIHDYRTNMLMNDMTYEKYLDLTKHLAGNKEHNTRRDDLLKSEEGIVQFEMLVYIKIWEADQFIKRLYQLVRLLNGQPYDWYFKLCKFRGEPKGCTGMRSTLLNKIIENFEPHSKVLSGFIKETYVTQLRNSIAHSTYSYPPHQPHIFFDLAVA